MLLDIAVNDSKNGLASANALKEAKKQGRLIVCECVIAEITPVCDQKTRSFLESIGIDYVPATHEAALLAGTHFKKYLSRGGKKGRIVIDFLIGAHASETADRLLTRDAGFLRDDFAQLNIWYPRNGAATKQQPQG